MFGATNSGKGEIIKYENLSFRYFYLLATKVAFVFLLGSLCISNKPRQLDFRKSKFSLTVEVDFYSPAFAALEDENLDFSTSSPVSEKKAPQLDGSMERKSLQPLKIKLRPMELSLHEILRETGYNYTFKRAGNRLAVQSIGVERPKAPSLPQPMQVAKNEVRGSHPLPAKAAIRLFHPTVAEVGASSKTSTGGSAVTSESHSSSQERAVFVAMSLPPTLESLFWNKERSAHGGQVNKKPGSSSEIAEQKNAGVENTQTVQAYSQNESHSQYSRYLMGGFEFVDGMALTDPQSTLLVYRSYFGQTLETGRVNWKTGSYDIYVQELKGELIGELRGAQGELLGRGKINLEKFAHTPKNQMQLGGIDLKISTLAQGVSGQIADGNAFTSGASKTLSRTYLGLLGHEYSLTTADDGQFVDQKFFPGTVLLARAEKQNYLPALHFLIEGLPNNLQMLPTAYIESLYKYLDIGNSPARGSLVFGIANNKGSPVQGVQVQMIDQPHAQAIYLNEYGLPDLELKSTAKNGQFLFVDVRPGLSALRANLNGKRSEIAILPLERGATSHIQLDLAVETKLKLETYLPFGNYQTVLSKVCLLGDKSKELESRETVFHDLTYAEIGGPLFVEIDSNPNNIPLTVTMERATDVYKIPMIEKQWIKSIEKAIGIQQRQDKGVIVGFVGGDKTYQVLLDQFPGVTSREQVFYFNQVGQLVPSLYAGVPGGGFIVLNADEGLRQILIRSQDGGIQYGQLVYVEQQTAGMLLKDF